MGIKLVLPLKVLTAQMPLPGDWIPVDDEGWEYVTDLLSAVEAALLGRVNYQFFKIPAICGLEPIKPEKQN